MRYFVCVPFNSEYDSYFQQTFTTVSLGPVHKYFITRRRSQSASAKKGSGRKMGWGLTCLPEALSFHLFQCCNNFIHPGGLAGGSVA